MGFSLIAAAAILGFTLFMGVEIIVSDLLPTIEEINISYAEMNERIQEQCRTGINITRVERILNGTNYEYTISVQNTGSTTLQTSDFIVLINGSQCDYLVSRQYFYPDNTIDFHVVNQVDGGVIRIKVITNNGIADYYTYSE
jgi:archaellum component FlaF (FlaF/FlaG flagellin family)